MKIKLILLVVSASLIMSFKGRERVLLVCYQDFPSSKAELISKEIQSFYNMEVSIVSKPLPDEAYYPTRGRYRADKLLLDLKMYKGDYNYVLGLTLKDISTTTRGHKDWGVFGLGYRPGSACVASFYRLKSNSRITKVALHEVGHNLGLPHCTSSKRCIMRESDMTLKGLDRELKGLCSDCKNKLKNR